MKFVQKFELIEEVQAIGVDLESLAIMSGVGETHGHSKEYNVKRDFKDIQIVFKIMFDAFTAERVGEVSKPPYGEGSSYGKKYEEKSSKGNGGKPPPSPPSSSSSSSPSASSSTSTTKTTHTNTNAIKGKTPLLKLDIKFELPMYNEEVNAKNLENWIINYNFIS